MNTNFDGEGYLIVRVSTARGAIPVDGAEVTIQQNSSDNTDILYSLTSGRDGLTNKVSLKTVNKSASETPGNDITYLNYTITVRADGYTSQYFAEVPIFDGITSYQSVYLVPSPSNQFSDNFIYDNTVGFEQDASNL